MKMPAVNGYVMALLITALGLSLVGRRDLAVVMATAAMGAIGAYVLAQFDVRDERRRR